VCKVNGDQAGKEFWLRKVIVSFDSPHAVTFPLGQD
jgi:hypothetical protein